MTRMPEFGPPDSTWRIAFSIGHRRSRCRATTGPPRPVDQEVRRDQESRGRRAPSDSKIGEEAPGDVGRVVAVVAFGSASRTVRSRSSDISTGGAMTADEDASRASAKALPRSTARRIRRSVASRRSRPAGLPRQLLLIRIEDRRLRVDLAFGESVRQNQRARGRRIALCAVDERRESLAPVRRPAHARP